MLLLQCVPLLGQTSVRGAGIIAVTRLPINFEPNQGQADFPTRFLARAGGMYLQMRPAEIDLRLGAAREGAALKLDLIDGGRKAHISPLERMGSETDYFLGRDPSGWHTHVPNFGGVRYEGIYPGIDLLFYGKREQLEHDFVVAPFADYRQIRMRVRGARAISLQPGGSLKIALATGNVIFHSPNVYQESKYGTVGRHGRFILLAANEVGFEISDYDRSKPLVIDPVLDCETFLASTPFQPFGVATDVSGNTHVSGVVGSSGAGAVLKVNSAGTGLVYAAYFGDSVQPYGGIAVDANGDAIVAASSSSTNVPLVNPVPFGFPGNGSWYAYVFSLSPDGSSMNYASLLGGGANPGQSSNTYIGGVALDPTGNEYVSGDTDSPVFPVTAGALNNNNVLPAYPNRIIYATKFLPNGKLGYSALIGNASPQNGGGGLIGVSGIAADSLGSAYIAGTAGILWPITATTYQEQIPGTAPYAAPFVTKLSADGSTLVYSTFLGSEAEPTAIVANGNGEAFVAGENAPRAFPTTGNAFQSTMTAGALIASFVSELSADGSQLLYSTFVQGQGAAGAQARTSVTSIGFNLTGDVWLALRMSLTSRWFIRCNRFRQRAAFLCLDFSAN